MKSTMIYRSLFIIRSLLSLIWRVKLYFLEEIIFIEWGILEFGSVNLIITLLFDWIRVRFIGGVLIISSLVILYSYEYIRGDPTINRFVILVFLFVISIVFLVLSPNIVRIMLGWDGLGLVSYCLVIYYQNIKSANAGMITILSNRVGDVALLLCISWIFNFGGWNFYYLLYIYKGPDTFLILVLVLLAAITKRAQIPFSAWLPAAIAAPTPVSSLVHSSTLVTAGVYLLIRFHELLRVNLFLFYISIITILISGLGANLEIDLKKIIALSTLSQLGAIIITLSLGLIELSYFHLLRHALFKSLLFLCVGVYIHSYGDIQDIRALGGVGVIIPVTGLFFIGCSLSLCGFPFLSGFYSKDLILEVIEMSDIRGYLLILVIVGTAFTFSYSIRLGYYIFVKNIGTPKIITGEERFYILMPIGLLFIESLVIGALFSWCFLSPVAVILRTGVKFIILTVGSIIIFFTLLFQTTEKKPLGGKLIKFCLGGIWFLPLLRTLSFVSPLIIGKKLLKYFDQGWIEELGGQGSFNKIILSSSPIDKWNMLRVKSYLILFFIFILFLLMIL